MYAFQSLFLKFVDDKNDLRCLYEIVSTNKLSLFRLTETIFLDELAVNIIDSHGFRFETVSEGDNPRDVIFCDL